jgi:hypothetical protein
MLPAFGAGRRLKSIRPADDFLHDLVGAAVDPLRMPPVKLFLEGMMAAAVLYGYIGCVSARSKAEP